MTPYEGVAPKAMRICAEDLADRLTRLQTLRDAKTEVAGLVLAAKTEASALVAAARESIATERAEMERQTQDQRSHMLQETAVARAAVRQTEVLGAVAELRERFEALTPWLAELVMSTVVRLVGAFDPDDCQKRILATALSEARRDWSLCLRCHPDDAHQLRALLETDRDGARQFQAVTAVVEDDRLEPGSCILASEAGIVEIGLVAQISALREALGLDACMVLASQGNSDTWGAP